jgi:hypothetical protein
MKWKRTVLVALILAMIGTTAVMADDIYETFKAKKLSITVNGKSIDKPALQVTNGGVMVPLEQLRDTVQAMVESSGDKITIYKPNVHMLLISSTIFGSVTNGKGKKVDFTIHTQVDNLKKPIKNMKFEIFDPNNKSVHESIHPISKEDAEYGTFWLNAPVSLQFDLKGDYTIKAYMQYEERGEYFLVAEKIVKSQ